MISVINSPAETRKKLSWQILKNAVAGSMPLDTRNVKEFDLFASSDVKNLFTRIPKNEKEWENLLNRAKEYLFLRSTRAVDSHLLSLFIQRFSDGSGVSGFFRERESTVSLRIKEYAKNAYVFNDNKNKDEELY